MYRLCFVLATCCAFFPSGSAAPKDRGQDPGSQWKDSVQQDEELREEMDGQENILSKVGQKHPLSEIFVRKLKDKSWWKIYWCSSLYSCWVIMTK